MFYRYKPEFYDAFKQAMTRPAPTAYPRLSAWAAQTRDLIRSIYAAAREQGLDEAARRALLVRIDRRDLSMETILATIRYHASSEYPYLLGEQAAHNVLAVHASNLNDRYLALRLSQSDALQIEPLRSRVGALRDHLDHIPNEPDATT